jgi:hypothetical protein
MFEAALLLAAAVAAPTENMHLICEGGTARQFPTSTTTGIVATSRGGSAVGSSVTTEPGYVPMIIQFRLQNGLAELSVPSYAGIRQGAGGWSKVKSLYVSDGEITGKVSAGMFDSSSFRIDRRTGTISSSGGYQGECRPMDASQRKF